MTGQLYVTPPASSKNIENTITINKSKEEIWSSFVPALAKSFFVINNIDKSSGFINVSYSGDPEKYVDCGQIHSWVKNIQGRRSYDFPRSRSYVEYEFVENGHLYQIKRHLTLDGRINITFEETASKETIITVTVKYVLSKNSEIFYLVVDRNLHSSWESRIFTDTASFTSGGEGYFTNDPDSCQATGLLEKEIIDLLRLK